MTTNRTLLLMRHGKSDWDAGVSDDFSRPLAARGRRDSPRIGRWLAGHGLLPDYIACSPAVRANETALLVCSGASLSTGLIYHDQRIYMADVGDLLDVIGEAPDCRGPLLLIGHNPGLEDLLLYLANDDAVRTGHRKIMPTAALAQLLVPGSRGIPPPGRAQLVKLVRPRELKGA